jgi:uncharacterized protein YjbJ (UPF0337 family)
MAQVDDQPSGKLNKVRGTLAKQWGRVTDEELQKINQKRTILIGKIQKKYGHRQKNTPPTE